jgi:hypothetical protein
MLKGCQKLKEDISKNLMSSIIRPMQAVSIDTVLWKAILFFSFVCFYSVNDILICTIY